MKNLKPNVKAGGKAKPIGNNLYYMSGRKHAAGGIDIGDTLEVEGGEVVQTNPNEVKVFSAQPILNGNSPAKLVMSGANPNKVFNAQEKFKDMNRLNDDGTSKLACGGRRKKTNGGLVTVNGNVVDRLVGNVSFPSSTGGRQKAALGTKDRKVRDKINYVVWNDKFGYFNKDGSFTDMSDVDNEDLPKSTPRYGARHLGNKIRQYSSEAEANRNVREITGAATRDAKKQAANSPVVRGNNFDRIEQFEPVQYKATGETAGRRKSNNTNKGTGFTVKRNGRNTHYPDVQSYVRDRDSKNTPIEDDVTRAAKRDAKGARTDFRSTLEVPEFTPTRSNRKTQSTTPTQQTRVTPVQQTAAPVTANTATPTTEKRSTSVAPRRRSETSKTPTAAAKSATPTANATNTISATPRFAELESMMQGLPTARGNTHTTLTSPVSTNQNVPDIISSPKKRLALFDKLDTNDIIGLGSNLAGTIASGINTNKALNSMNAPVEPSYETPAAMKTRFNIRPQIGEITENTRRAMDDIEGNTSSSRVALQRKQRARNASQYAKNSLYGQKENIETQLINQDRLNRQQVGARNTAAHNDWKNRTTQFNNAIREQKASSLNRTFSGINAGIQDMLTRIENRRNYNNTLGVYDATHPNVDRRLFTSKGVKF